MQPLRLDSLHILRELPQRNSQHKLQQTQQLVLLLEQLHINGTPVTDGQLTEGTKYTGTATTELYINGVESPADNGAQYYLSADYVAIGTSPNANNESFTSSRANLTVYPENRNQYSSIKCHRWCRGRHVVYY